MIFVNKKLGEADSGKLNFSLIKFELKLDSSLVEETTVAYSFQIISY